MNGRRAHSCSAKAVWIPAFAGIHWFYRVLCRVVALTDHGCRRAGSERWKAERDPVWAAAGRQEAGGVSMM